MSNHLVSALVLAAAVSMNADAAQRTFVASYGSDANPCSATLPCRSFATAMAVTDPSGEVLVIDTAGYGTVTIGQSVGITVPEGVYAGITVGSGSGVTVNGSAIEVVLRGLSINSLGVSGDGIQIDAASSVTIERCVVTNMPSSAVHVAAAGARVAIADSDISLNNSGVLVDGAATLSIDRSSIERNFTGIDGALTTANIAVRDSSISGNPVANIILRVTSSQQQEIELARNLVFGSDTDGINTNSSFGNATGTIKGIVAGNVIHANAGTGIFASCCGPNTALTVAGNLITANGQGLNIDATHPLRSAQDNVVDGNASPDLGTMLAATVK